jgi:hypothetical protein
MRKPSAGRIAMAAGVPAVFVACLLGYRWVERDGGFDLSSIGVWGCRMADSVPVATVLAPLVGTPLGSLDLSDVEARLESLPGVEAAEVWREWPREIGVWIRPARPVVVFEYRGALSPVSDRGENLPASFLSDTLPVVSISGSPDPEMIRRIVIWLAGDGSGCPVDGLILEARGLVARTGGCTVILGDRDFSGRLESWSSVRACGFSGEGWDEVDMRFSGRVVLRKLDRTGAS